MIPRIVVCLHRRVHLEKQSQDQDIDTQQQQRKTQDEGPCEALYPPACPNARNASGSVVHYAVPALASCGEACLAIKLEYMQCHSLRWCVTVGKVDGARSEGLFWVWWVGGCWITCMITNRRGFKYWGAKMWVVRRVLVRRERYEVWFQSMHSSR